MPDDVNATELPAGGEPLAATPHVEATGQQDAPEAYHMQEELSYRGDEPEERPSDNLGIAELLAVFATGADLPFFKMPGCEDATEVHYSHDGDAGLNIYPYFKEARQTLAKGQRVSYRTGTGVALPAGTVLFCNPRSGLAKNTGITVLNAPGTIDQPYQGEIEIIAINHSDQDFTVERDRPLAQLVWLPVLKATPKYGPPPAAQTTRGAGGFGSTG